MIIKKTAIDVTVYYKCVFQIFTDLMYVCKNCLSQIILSSYCSSGSTTQKKQNLQDITLYTSVCLTWNSDLKLVLFCKYLLLLISGLHFTRQYLTQSSIILHITAAPPVMFLVLQFVYISPVRNVTTIRLIMVLWSSAVPLSTRRGGGGY